MRPIISSIGTFSYKTAKYLSKLLSPLVVNNYLLIDSYNFVSRLRNLNFRNAHVLSFNVESLFTNIPTDSTINLILERVYKNKEIDIMIPEHELKKLLNLCIKDNIFLFDGSLYQQVDGVAMGSPLGPLLANIFMAYVANLLFKSNLNEEIGFWARYVDDVLVIFNKINPKINDILLSINNVHPNNKFTVENEVNHHFHFLDIDIEFINGTFKTHTYHKPTATGLYTMRNSFTPLNYKLSTIRCLFSRSFKICRYNNLLLKEKIQLINNVHFKLDYPLHILNEVFRVCVSNILTDKLIYYGLHKPKLFVSLPFIGQLSCSK